MTSSSLIKQEVAEVNTTKSTEVSTNITIKQEAAEATSKNKTSPSPLQATRSLLKQSNITKIHPNTSVTSIVKDCFKSPSHVNKEISSGGRSNSEQIKVLNTSPSNKTESSIKIISPNQGSLARFLCGQIKVEPGTSVNNFSLSSIQSKAVLNSVTVKNESDPQIDNTRMLQHHDYAKPVNINEKTIPIENTTRNIQVVSGSSLLKTNVRTISDLSLLGGKKIIQLKPVNSANQLKTITVSPKQTNQVISVNQNKTIQVLNSASILKTVPSNGVSKLVNGTKLMLTKGGENSQRVILVKMDKNGKFQQIPQQSVQNLPPLPPLVMIKKPLSSNQLVSSGTTTNINPGIIKPIQIGSSVNRSIKIEPGTVNNSLTNVKEFTSNQQNKSYSHSVLINKQQLMGLSNKSTGNIVVGSKQIYTVATSSGLNVLVRQPDPETVKFERLVLNYEQQLKYVYSSLDL